MDLTLDYHAAPSQAEWDVWGENERRGLQGVDGSTADPKGTWAVPELAPASSYMAVLRRAADASD